MKRSRPATDQNAIDAVRGLSVVSLLQAFLMSFDRRIYRFIDYYNTTMARPYRWTCDGTLLCK